MRTNIILSLIIFVSLTGNVFAQSAVGTVKGNVVNATTNESLFGVNVALLNMEKGATTTEAGEFTIANVPVGSYNLKFSYIGFENLTISDVMVRPDRITHVNAGLKESVLEGQQVVVTAGYFQKADTEPTSNVTFNFEEIRRAPGSAGDISRILVALPSAAQVSDNSNDLMVRGGSPVENGFYVDNIRIPNINHFPVQGSTGGPIGLLNVDFIENVNFYCGGFSAAYGSALSSVIDIEFREGNRDTYDTQLDLSMAGFGGIIEGPLNKGRGAWFFSARKSYLDLIVGAIGTGVAPRYMDFQGKLSYDLNAKHKLSLLNIFGTSNIEFKKDDQIEDGSPNYGKYEAWQNTIGLNVRSIWAKGYSNTSISYSFIQSQDHWNRTINDELVGSDDFLDGAIRFRNVNSFRLNKRHKLQFGCEMSYDLATYDYFFDDYTDRLGNYVPSLAINDDFNSTKSGVFVSYIWNPFENLTTSFGSRLDYFAFNEKVHLSPRFSTTYAVNNILSFNAAFGMFSQQLPTFVLSQAEANKSLDDPQAFHYVLGLDYMLTGDTKLTLEAYYKHYDNLPLQPSDPTLSIIDEGRFNNYFHRYYNLTDTGIAMTKGIELLIQKKLAVNVYGMISGSYFRSRYQDYEGHWRDRLYDNRYILNVIGGYKPNNKWELSVRWNFAGGVPYTPFDEELSQNLNVGIIDQTQINTVRYPNYHTLNVRFDRRFYFKSKSIVLSLNVLNAYNRKNISFYYWNEIDNKQDVIYQWSFMPVGGFEFEF